MTGIERKTLLCSISGLGGVSRLYQLYPRQLLVTYDLSHKAREGRTFTASLESATVEAFTDDQAMTRVVATAPNGTVITGATLTVLPVVPIPSSVPPQTATENQAFSLNVPAFTDPNGDPLTYAFSGLADWLKVADPAVNPRYVSGRPPYTESSATENTDLHDHAQGRGPGRQLGEHLGCPHGAERLAMLIAGPVGLLSAVYPAEYASPRVRGAVKPVLEIMAGIPSVVLGFFALTFINPNVVQTLVPSAQGFNLAAAAVGVGILTIPLVATISEDSMRAVPQALREAAYGLGARPATTAMRVVVPAAVSGIMAAMILGVCRAVGETMVVAIAAGASGGSLRTVDPFGPGQTMTAAMAALATGSDQVTGDSAAFQSLFFVGLVLFVLTLGPALEQEKKKTLIDKIWDFLASVKLAIVVFALISFTSTIGTILEQRAEPAKNMQILSKLFGESLAPSLYNISEKFGVYGYVSFMVVYSLINHFFC